MLIDDYKQNLENLKQEIVSGKDLIDQFPLDCNFMIGWGHVYAENEDIFCEYARLLLECYHKLVADKVLTRITNCTDSCYTHPTYDKTKTKNLDMCSLEVKEAYDDLFEIVKSHFLLKKQ